jgi:3-hydroxyisobutyrate dehydrogenase-like beta-hydroxyacid dehydrogenase
VAANLLKAGLPVVVFDRNPAAVDKLVKLGAKAVGSPQELGETPGKLMMQWFTHRLLLELCTAP